MNNQEFFNKISKIVTTENQKRGNKLFSSVVIAQAILESGWGSSVLMMKANAVFGIKAGSNWKGKVYNSSTKEVYNGNYVNVNAYFRAYNSLEESISDYFNLILNSSRYSKALNCDNFLECITEIRNGGYATDPKYVNKIVSLINQYNLVQYDIQQNVENSDNIEQLAKDTINGKYGNGEERKQRLGSLYGIVQAKVNELMGVNKQTEIIYTVQKGDCLSKIAQKYNTTVSKIAELNGITNVDFIKVGQKLLIRR